VVRSRRGILSAALVGTVTGKLILEMSHSLQKCLPLVVDIGARGALDVFIELLEPILDCHDLSGDGLCIHGTTSCPLTLLNGSDRGEYPLHLARKPTPRVIDAVDCFERHTIIGGAMEMFRRVHTEQWP
jgi:hypothetical protein